MSSSALSGAATAAAMVAAAAAAAAYIVHKTGTPVIVQRMDQDLASVTTPAPPPSPIAKAVAATGDAAAAAAAAVLPASLLPSPTRHGTKRASFLLDSPLAGVTADDLHVPPPAPPRVARAASRAFSDIQKPGQDDWAEQMERLGDLPF